MKLVNRIPAIVAMAFSLAVPLRAWAVVEAEMPLAQLVKDSNVVALVTLTSVDLEKSKGTLHIERVLRGDEPQADMPVKLLAVSGGEGHPSDMLNRVEEGTKLVLFL